MIPEDAVQFVVPGRPLTWARARLNPKNPRSPHFTPVDRENRMSEVRDGWRDAAAAPFGRDEFLVLSCRFYFRRPSNHFRANGELKDWAWAKRPGSGSNGGDLDNLVKLVKDALNSVAFHDDAQIAEFDGTGKHYVRPGEMPRTEVGLWLVPLVAIPAPEAQEALLSG